MASFSNASFSVGGFSVLGFDLGAGPAPTPAENGNTPGFIRSLRGIGRMMMRGEDEEERAARRAQMYPTPEAPKPAPKRKGPPGPARWKNR